MSSVLRCPCGRRVRVLDADESADCPACGRTLVVAERRRSVVPWVLGAAAAGGLFALVLGGVLVARFLARPAPAPAEQPDLAELLRTFPRDSSNFSRAAPVEPIAPELAPAPRPFVEPPPAAPPAPPPALPGPPRVGRLEPTFVEPAGRYRVGDAFDQEVVVTRRSAFRVLGAEVVQGAQYAFASSVSITKVNADGSLVAEQTIRSGRLLDAGADMKAELAAALEKAQGTRFEITVSPAGAVTALKGPKDPIRVLAGNGAMPGQSLRLWSLLDEDAWKELAGLTFFQPDKPLKPGATWTRAAAHDWGPLGSWRGNTGYLVARPPKTGQERVDYAHDIYHVPPAAGAGGNLPIKVAKAEFKTVAAGGAILYDPATRRATAAEETFRVRGAVAIALGGADAVVEMEELQGFRLTVIDRHGNELIGRPPPKK